MFDPSPCHRRLTQVSDCGQKRNRRLAHSVAHSRILLVSIRIVAGRDDFAERGSVSRSTFRATDALDLSKHLAVDKAPAGHRPALLWLRLRRATPYRRFVIGRASDRFHDPRSTHVWQSATLRYSRLQVCATGVGNTVNRYTVSTVGMDSKRTSPEGAA